MDRKLDWSRLAIADRNAIFDYIEADSPTAAEEIDERIRVAVENLLRFSEMGRNGRIEETRELVIPRTPYIAVYQISHETIRILRVLHGARQWPEELPR